MDMKASLKDLLERARDQERRLADILTPAEQRAAGTREHWSTRDALAHIAAWKRRTAERLAGCEEPLVFASQADIDLKNTEIFEANQAKSWEQVQRDLGEAYALLVQQVEALSEEALWKPDQAGSGQGTPLWRGIIGNGYSHPILHLAALYQARGDQQASNQLPEEAARLLAALDDSPAWKSATTYNLACHYSLSGQRDKAITNLVEALRLDPGLTAWSKQDPDFEPLREDPAYLAIYTA